MNADPGMNMFRRFSYLHLRQLLYMQEELCCLEDRLNEIDLEDKDRVNVMSRRFDTNTERHNLMTEIKVKLGEYGSHIQSQYISIRIEYSIDCATNR